MKIALALAALLAASPALAATKKIPIPTPRPDFKPVASKKVPVPTFRPKEVISCSFTEPFFSVEFNEETGTVKYMSANDSEVDEATGDTIYKVRYSYGYQKVRTGDNSFVIKNEQGRIALQLVLDFQGNDGMSDIITPYSGKYGEFEGGCSSNFYKNKVQ